MPNQVIAFASDHAGYVLKDALCDFVKTLGYDVLDLGTNGPDSVDYPEYGKKMGEAIASEAAQAGVLVCGSGIGISIAANRNPAVRAALCHDVTTARLCRQHNDANVIALGERLTGIETAKQAVEAFLGTEFEGGRHQRRVDLLSR